MKRAFITGITGQDGSYLAELLLAEGYHVTGLVRRTSAPAMARLAHLIPNPDLVFIPGDMTDGESLRLALRDARPSEIYNLAAMSFVGASWAQPVLTFEVNTLGLVRLLDAVRAECPTARVYQASSSEQFGMVRETPQSESTPFNPRSPYGCSKAAAHYVAVNYRESYGLHVSCGILFNHESERRGPEFVTRKIAMGVAAITRGEADHLSLGNLDAGRDWGFAGDYVRAMYLMLQQDEPHDYVIATGTTHTVRDFCRLAFAAAGIGDWERHVRVDPAFIRPAEVPTLCGRATRAMARLQWMPTLSFEGLVTTMVQAELAAPSRAA